MGHSERGRSSVVWARGRKPSFILTEMAYTLSRYAMRLISIVFAVLIYSGVADGASSDTGARLADSCTSCHGTNGRGRGAMPALAGQDEQQLKTRMAMLAAGDPQATIMSRLLRAYNEAEISALARFFAQARP